MSQEQNFVEAGPSSVVDRRYRIKREIARGSMGIVHEAEHTTLRTTVAIKTLTSGALMWPLVHSRLMREGRALSMVRHPSVASVLDAGVCPTHGPYLVLGMVEGRSLQSFIVARGRLDVETVVHTAIQLGGALAAAHEHGIVHRDVKPANILVGRSSVGPGDALVLVDFGIASLPGSDDVVDRKLTASGEILGTVEYMAPEQLLDGATPSPATDIYGLGATLYECLMGDVPYPGTPIAVMTAMLQGKAVGAIAAARPDVSPALAAAVMKAMARDPHARFESAHALVLAFTAAGPALTRPLTLLERAEEGGAARRRFGRAAYVTPVRIVTVDGAADGRSEDVSEGGLLVVTQSNVTEGAHVSVRLPLPSSGRVVTCDAIARWARTRRGQKAIGLAFTSLPEEARVDIERYVRLMSGAEPAAPQARETKAA